MSVLFQIKSHKVADLPWLMRLVLRSIYDRKTMPAADLNLMEYSMVQWTKKLKEEQEIHAEKLRHFKWSPKANNAEVLDPPHKFLEDYLQRLGWLLVRDQDGKFDRRKELFKKHNIDYRKFHKLPEALTLEDIEKAQMAYREYAKKNPDLEDMGKQSTPEVKKILKKREADMAILDRAAAEGL